MSFRMRQLMVQAYWAERLGWEMGLVHAFMLDMFERLYAVSDFLRVMTELCAWGSRSHR